LKEALKRVSKSLMLKIVCPLQSWIWFARRWMDESKACFEELLSAVAKIFTTFSAINFLDCQ
jgi:hypothetical protein